MRFWIRPLRALLVPAIFACVSVVSQAGEKLSPADRHDAAASNIKGLQVQMVDDALALGVKQAALNVSITSLIDLDFRPDSLRYRMAGREYAFHRGAVESIPVKAALRRRREGHTDSLVHDDQRSAVEPDRSSRGRQGSATWHYRL